MNLTRKSIILVLFVFLACISYAEDVVFTAQAPKAVVVGDNFKLVYTVNVSNAKKLRIAEIDDCFEVLTGPSISSRSSTSIRNGKIESSSSVSHTYVLVGTKEGEYTIPGATVEVGNSTYTSNSVKIKVLPADDSSQQGGNNNSAASYATPASDEPTSSKGEGISNSSLFMRAIVNKTDVYEQEAVLLTFKVYSLVDLRSLTNKMPDLKNFHVQEIELPKEKEFELEHYNGKNYHTLTWCQYVLFPQQSGVLEIPSTTFEGVVAQSVQSNDIFDMFFNGGRYVETNKTLITQPIKINVKPLPGGKSSSFTGGVGNFTISSDISTTEVKENEAVTITVTLSGSGNMKLVKTPEIVCPNDFEVYDPKIDNRFTVKSSGQQGEKVYEYLIIPRHSGQYTIPGIEFQYFDVPSASYKTLSTQDFSLNVLKGEGASVADISGYVSKEELKYVGQDVRFRTTGNKVRNYDRLFFNSLLFWILIFVMLLALAIVFAVNTGVFASNENADRSRKKRANSVAVKRMKSAHKLMAENQKDGFYDEVFKALYGYVGDKLNIPVAELSKDNIAAKLGSCNISDEEISHVMKLIEDCEFARYSPGDDAQRMDQVYTEAVDMIEQLDNLLRRQK